MMQLNSQFQTTQTQGVSVESIIGNSDVMNFLLMAEIEKELLDNPNDMISLVFLLYDVPDTALRRLIEFQRVANDAATSTNFNMLHEWFQYAKHNPNWKHVFVEALLICQLHSVVRKLGINVPATRRYYQTDSITVKMYVNPMKKALYKLCEGINSDNLLTLKKALLESNIDTTEYDSCELVFLKLMCDKFITINQYQYNKNVMGFKMDVQKLIKIVESLPGLRKLVLEINMLQETLNETSKTDITVTASAPSKHKIVDELRQRPGSKNGVSKPGIMVNVSAPSEHKLVDEPRQGKESLNVVSKSHITAAASAPSENEIEDQSRLRQKSMNGVSEPGIRVPASAPPVHEIVDQSRQRKESINDVSEPDIMSPACTPSEDIRADESNQEQADKMYLKDLEDTMLELCGLPDDTFEFCDDLESDAAVSKCHKPLKV